MSDQAKVPLPRFLKIFTSNNVAVPKAMAIAGKLYKSHSTPAQLKSISDLELIRAGILDKDDRKLVIASLRKSGYAASKILVPGPSSSANTSDSKPLASTSNSGVKPLEPSDIPDPVLALADPLVKKKRKRASTEKNEFLPDTPEDDTSELGSLDFQEVIDEKILETKSTVINRAPLMTAWATVVAERIGFAREEALSIASVYTEMNAVAKGQSLGLYGSGRDDGLEAVKGGSQPFVEFMGRRIPLYQAQSSQWRALQKGRPIQPSTAFLYITRSFRQTTPYIIGALRLLAASYTSQSINGVAWSLYADFRPIVDGWGKRGQVKCKDILDLRRPSSTRQEPSVREALPVKIEDGGELTSSSSAVTEKSAKIADEPDHKRARSSMTVEEYEAELDRDHSLDYVDLSNVP